MPNSLPVVALIFPPTSTVVYIMIDYTYVYNHDYVKSTIIDNKYNGTGGSMFVSPNTMNSNINYCSEGNSFQSMHCTMYVQSGHGWLLPMHGQSHSINDQLQSITIR